VRNQIPGQARAYDMWLAIILAVFAWASIGSWRAAVGAALIAIGSFLGAQATHLAQMQHSDPPPTILERQMQDLRWIFVILGIAMALTGLHLVLKP